MIMQACSQARVSRVTKLSRRGIGCGKSESLFHTRFLYEKHQFACASIFLTFLEIGPEIFLTSTAINGIQLDKMGYPFFVSLVYSDLNAILNILNVIMTTYRLWSTKTLHFGN